MYCIAATNWRLVLLPFLGVSSLDFGPLETAAFFLSGRETTCEPFGPQAGFLSASTVPASYFSFVSGEFDTK
jgi:hypothetical protein